MSTKPTNYLLPVYLSVALVLGGLIGHFTHRGVDGERLKNLEAANKIYEVLNILDQNYVDDINKDSLFNASINDLLHKLDPHSNYIPASQVARLKESIEGKFGGIGVRFFIYGDTICVTNVIENTPAFRAGLLSGDRIVKISGENVAGIGIQNETVMNLLKGVSGSEVELTVLRNNAEIPFKFNRGTVPISSIGCSYMLDSITGLIQIDQFSIPTHEEFRQAAKLLLSQSMKQLIVDLRNNGGGVMESAVRIVDEFLSEGQLIVSAQGKHFDTQNIYSTKAGMLENMPLVILINEYSASASEIVAGAIQDNDRGVILGKTSFGKGLIQEDQNMKDGSNLRVTVARYYTPSGRCIQRPYSDLSYEEYLKGGASSYNTDDSIRNGFPDSLKFKTVYKKRTVYGGGGIYPDIYLERDTTLYSAFFLNARLVGAFTAFSFDYLRNKRQKWKNFSAFKSDAEITSFNVDSFYAFCEKEYRLFMLERETEANIKLLRKWIIAEIARQLWIENGFYQIMNETEPAVLKARQVLKKYPF